MEPEEYFQCMMYTFEALQALRHHLPLSCYTENIPWPTNKIESWQVISRDTENKRLTAHGKSDINTFSSRPCRYGAHHNLALLGKNILQITAVPLWQRCKPREIGNQSGSSPFCTLTFSHIPVSDKVIGMKHTFEFYIQFCKFSAIITNKYCLWKMYSFITSKYTLRRK